MSHEVGALKGMGGGWNALEDYVKDNEDMDVRLMKASSD